MPKKILIIDDDEALCTLARDYLQRYDFDTTFAHRPTLALQTLSRQRFDAAVVDVMMPEMDGFELVRRIRASDDKTPLLMLSARGDVTDRIIGLETGADDYLPKPFEPRELAARLTALCRRPAPLAGGGALTFAHLRIDPQTQRVEKRNGNHWQDIHLTAGEFRALAVLVSARPAVVSRDELSARLHGLEFDIADRSLDITISRIRQKLGDSAQQPRFIKTMRNAGYAFIAAPADSSNDSNGNQ